MYESQLQTDCMTDSYNVEYDLKHNVFVRVVLRFSALQFCFRHFFPVSVLLHIWCAYHVAKAGFLGDKVCDNQSVNQSWHHGNDCADGEVQSYADTFLRENE